MPAVERLALAISPPPSKNIRTVEADLKAGIFFSKIFRHCISYQRQFRLRGRLFPSIKFSTPDTIRHHYAVQYMQLPDYPWARLRKEKPEQYESNVLDPPLTDRWFHIKLIIDREWITVYPNYACTASLRVKSLWDNREGKIAL